MVSDHKHYPTERLSQQIDYFDAGVYSVLVSKQIAINC